MLIYDKQFLVAIGRDHGDNDLAGLGTFADFVCPDPHVYPEVGWTASDLIYGPHSNTLQEKGSPQSVSNRSCPDRLSRQSPGWPEGRDRNTVMDHHSFRDQLTFSIGFAVSRSRALLRRLLTEHAPDDAQRELAERVIKQLELSFVIDEAEQCLKRRPPSPRPRI
jgi:hypothetical protein